MVERDPLLSSAIDRYLTHQADLPSRTNPYPEFIEVSKTTPADQPDPVIKEMPTRELLEAFLQGMSGPVRVVFSRDRGRFEWLVEDAP